MAQAQNQKPLVLQRRQGAFAVRMGVDCDHYQLSSNDTPVGNVSRGTSTQRREQVP